MPTRSPGALTHSDDLVAQDERQVPRRNLAVEEVEVGAADAARVDAYADEAGPKGGIGQLGSTERLAGPVEDHRSHPDGLHASPCGDPIATSFQLNCAPRSTR